MADTSIAKNADTANMPAGNVVHAPFEKKKTPRRSSKLIWRQIPVATKYRFKMILLIALGWTLIDLIYLLIRLQIPGISPDRDLFNYDTIGPVILREVIVYIFSAAMVSVLFFQAHADKIELPIVINFLLKTGLLVLLAFLMNFLLFLAYFVGFLHKDPGRSFGNFLYYTFHTPWMVKKTPGWVLTFSLLQVIVEMVKKYSPG